jgi:hypothetical protein
MYLPLVRKRDRPQKYFLFLLIDSQWFGGNAQLYLNLFLKKLAGKAKVCTFAFAFEERR